MRNFFALLVIAGAVVALGVFRVPDGDALVAKGIAAEARAAVYQTRHPLTIKVKGRVVTVSGRVESDADRIAVLRDLRNVDGVERVRDALTVLPQVAPFALRLDKGTDWALQGHVPLRSLNAQLEDVVGQDLPDLPVATGTPDRDWPAVVLAGAKALRLMDTGTFEITDAAATLRGVIALPQTRDQIDAILSDIPEAYEQTIDLSAIDDGRPYAVTLTRDALMGTRAWGKLPPDFDLAVFADLPQVTETALENGPVALDAPGFAEAVTAALPVFAMLEHGTLSLSPGALTLSGGPAPTEVMEAARAMADTLPQDWQRTLSLTPTDTAVPLSLRVTWDGTRIRATGKVPADFDLNLLGDTPAVTLGPYPDLAGWAAQIGPALRALRNLQSGVLEVTETERRLSGIAPNPDAMRAVRTVFAGGDLDVVLRDDGTPPALRLVYDAARGGVVSGKLPARLRLSDLQDRLSVPLSGDPRRAPAGDAAPFVMVMDVLAPWMPVMDTLEMSLGAQSLTLTASLIPGARIARIQQLLTIDLPDHAVITLTEAIPPLTGTTRVNATSGRAETFRAGGWLPDVGFAPSLQTCQAAPSPDIAFEPGSLRYAAHDILAVNELAALVRACTRLAGLRATLSARVTSGGNAALNAQLERRRALALRDTLIARGVAADRITTAPAEGPGLRDTVMVRFVP